MKDFLTTGEAAALCAVTPDTVLKWVRSGKIRANRTAGGHHRIPHSELLPIIGSRPDLERERPAENWEGGFQYCWEYHSKNGKLAAGCRRCIVYRSRSRRCYQMRDLPVEAGHARMYCDRPCEDCEYYQTVGRQRANVMVVSDQEEFRKGLEHQACDAEFNLLTTDCEYRASMIIEKQRPDFIVIDCSIGRERSRDFAQLVNDDPRIPFVRVILAGSGSERPAECDKLVFAMIRRPFTIKTLAKLIEGSRHARSAVE